MWAQVDPRRGWGRGLLVVRIACEGVSENPARDLRYGRRGGGWLPKETVAKPEPLTDPQLMSEARAVLMVVDEWPACSVLSTTKAVKDRVAVLWKLRGER